MLILYDAVGTLADAVLIPPPVSRRVIIQPSYKAVDPGQIDWWSKEIVNYDAELDFEAEQNVHFSRDDNTDMDTGEEGCGIESLLQAKVLDLDHIHDSAQVVMGQTSGYRRLGPNFWGFLVEIKRIKAGETIFVEHPPADTPVLIAAWIMNSCDELKINGRSGLPKERRLSFPNAQSMRAALKRRKIRAGEVATIMCDITPAILEDFYDLNHTPKNSQALTFGGRSGKGPLARRLCFAAYLLAFYCFLKVDEVLKIQAHFIRRDPENCIIVSLPFKKTHLSEKPQSACNGMVRHGTMERLRSGSKPWRRHLEPVASRSKPHCQFQALPWRLKPCISNKVSTRYRANLIKQERVKDVLPLQ
ncbi:hypothetical protein C8R46DRAFT_1249102 [Mycena filopes]|nr:hypothetical protein C8R46DRAFT_1249102 [Mycena filopes]